MHGGRGIKVGPARTLVAVAVAGAAPVPVALAATSQTVKILDGRGDVGGVLDLQRASLGLGSDGRLRVVVTLAARAEPRALLAGTGPPGSVCVKIWTAQAADPASSRADRLVCVTPRSSDELRASVLSQAVPGLPVRVAPASVRQTKSRRSLVVRISQSSLGRPRLIRFAVESTRPGCTRVSCIDTAPDGGAVRRFRIR